MDNIRVAQLVQELISGFLINRLLILGVAKNVVIALVPYLKDNTTSVNRFNNILLALNRYFNLQIVYFEYPGNFPTKGSAPLTTINLSILLNAYVTVVPVQLNIVQKLAFGCLSKRQYGYFRLLNWLHTFLFGIDVYHSASVPLNTANGGDGVVIAFGTPGLFRAGSLIADNLGYKLILDYRDPWTFGYSTIDSNRIINFIRALRQRSIEHSMLKKADLVTTVSLSIKKQFPPSLQNKIEVISNGSNVTIDYEICPRPKIFNIVYVGTIYDDQLKEEAFFTAFCIFISKKATSNILLTFAGAFKSEKLKSIIKKHKLEAVSIISERVLFEKLAPILQNASLFLHLRYGNRSGIITSKQADYLAYRKPILLPVSDNGDLAESITKHKAGFVCNGAEETLAVLEQQYQKFLNGESCVIEQDEEYLRTHTREYIAEQFVDLVDGLFEEKPSSPSP